MALVHEFENSGNWLLKRRSWLPGFLIVAGIIAMYLGNRQAILFDMRNELIFLGVSLIGELIRIITVGFAARKASGRSTVPGQAADELNVTGIYSLVRHPLYLGNFIILIGPVLFIHSFCFAIISVLVYWLYYERIMFADEQYLRRKFGNIYDKWSETVRPFLPNSLKFIRPKLPFSVRNVLAWEYNSFIKIFMIFVLLDIFRNYFLSTRLSITPMWIYLGAGAMVVWSVLWVINKNTGWLMAD